MISNDLIDTIKNDQLVVVINFIVNKNLKIYQKWKKNRNMKFEESVGKMIVEKSIEKYDTQLPIFPL